MMLEILLDPFREADKEILSYYAKGVEKINGFDDTENLTSSISIIDLLLTLGTYAYQQESSLQSYAIATGLTSAIAHIADLFHGYHKNKFKKQLEKSESLALDPLLFKMNAVSACSRLPTIILGTALTLKGGIDLTLGIAGEPAGNDSFVALYSGLTLLGLASSMYIKGIDDNIARRKPFFQKMYEGAKERLTLSIPETSSPQFQTEYQDYSMI